MDGNLPYVQLMNQQHALKIHAQALESAQRLLSAMIGQLYQIRVLSSLDIPENVKVMSEQLETAYRELEADCYGKIDSTWTELRAVERQMRAIANKR